MGTKRLKPGKFRAKSGKSRERKPAGYLRKWGQRRPFFNFLCYSRGIITSRPIEYACKINIVVKALARDAESDHNTIAHFISSQAEAVKGFFAQVVLKCYALGLTGGELSAIDEAMIKKCGYPV